MTKIQTRFYSALGLLAILCLSTAVSLAQRTTESATTIDPFSVLPASDGLIVVDLKRFSSSAVPRLLVDEQAARALVIALFDPITTELIDPRAVQRSVVGLRYSNSGDDKNPWDVEAVTVAQSSEAGQLPTLIRSRGPGKYREQQYAGKILYIRQSEQTEPKGATSVTSSEESKWAIVALDRKYSCLR